jgi:hypothetical protein
MTTTNDKASVLTMHSSDAPPEHFCADCDARVAELERLQEAVLSVHGDLAERHGESCDCERCLVIQPLADIALKDTDR